MEDRYKQMQSVVRRWGKLLEDVRAMQPPERDYVVSRMVEDVRDLKGA